MLLRLSTLTLALLIAGAHAAGAETGPAPLTLRDALAAALRDNPELEAAARDVGTRQAQVWQAGLLPNPELRLEAENIGGSGDLAGVESAESTFKLAQLVELGGKRSARIAVAERVRDVAAGDVELRRATLAAATARAFVAVLAAQEELHLAERLHDLGDDAVAAVAAQMRAGGASEANVLRARLLRDEAGLVRVRREQELAAARADLAALWGGGDPAFARVAGDLSAIAPPLALPALLARADGSPEVARWQRELASRASLVDAERAGAIPDLLLGAGPRYFSDTGDVALVAEITVPLPVFDRRQGAIAAARAHLAAGEAEKRAAAAALRASVARAHAALTAGYALATALREHLLPDADETLTVSRDAYRRGALQLDELHDAQRALVELRGREIEVLASYHQTAAELTRLVGGTIDGSALPGEVTP
jgi:outer membrane protein, heavy metal efflux system